MSMSILIQISYLLCLKGDVHRFRDGQVKISKGEMFIVPRGVEHKPFTEKESHIMLVEPKRKWIDNRKKIKGAETRSFFIYLTIFGNLL